MVADVSTASPDDLRRRRPPLTSSEKDIPRRPRIKEITSRYLSSYSPSTSSTTMAASTSSTRRCSSPIPTPRPSTTPALPQSSTPKRSNSVDRSRPNGGNGVVCTTTRSLSVSFQGESFFYQTSKTKPISPNLLRKPTPERRRPNVGILTKTHDHLENSLPFEQHHRWPSARARQSDLIAGSLDCSGFTKDPILGPVVLVTLDEVSRRASFDGGELSASSDTDSVSSGSNSGATEPNVQYRVRATPRGISIPARFRQLPQLDSQLLSLGSKMEANSKVVAGRKLFVESPIWSPRLSSSPLRGSIRPDSPSKLAGSPSRAMASPSRVSSSMYVSSCNVGHPSNAPSILSFAAEVRRAKKGESRIEEAHLLRLFDNRHLQWRYINAWADSGLLVERLTAKKTLYNAWIAILEMRDSLTSKRTKLQALIQRLKLTSILKGQMTYLEEWSLVDQDHANSLSGGIEALKASTLRLPVVGRARADLLEVKDAVSSAVDMMRAMGSSICSLLSKAEGMSSLVAELTRVTAQERDLLDQSRDLLCTLASLQVKQCSLRGHMLQLNCKRRVME